MNTRIRVGLILACVGALAAVGTMSVRAIQPVPEERGAREAANFAAYQRTAMAVGLIGQGETGRAQATAIFDGMIANPQHPTDVVEGFRLKSLVSAESGDNIRALSYLGDAQAALDASPEVRERFPHLAPIIAMDRAQRSHDDPAAAIALYDGVRGMVPGASDRDVRIATQNAMFLAAKMGDSAGAVVRSDELLASPLLGLMPVDEVIGVRLSQVGWLADSGRLPEAAARGTAVWNEYPAEYTPEMIRLGTQLAGWLPAPSQCDARVQLSQEVLARIQLLQQAQANGRAPGVDAAAVRTLELQALTVLADTFGCNGTNRELVQWARAQLGLTPEP